MLQGKSRSILILIMAAATLGLAAFFFLSGNRESIKQAPVDSSDATAAAPVDERPKRKVDLFFLREEDDRLVREAREIVADPASAAAEAHSILIELIRGSSAGLLSALPAETKLIQVYVTKEGTAYVDLSREFADRHPSGSSAEIATVYAVVDSLAANLKTVKKVFLLVEGEERETLAGHVALDRPIVPDYSLIAKD
jgi:spore germination protein GerM